MSTLRSGRNLHPLSVSQSRSKSRPSDFSSDGSKVGLATADHVTGRSRTASIDQCRLRPEALFSTVGIRFRYSDLVLWGMGAVLPVHPTIQALRGFGTPNPRAALRRHTGASVMSLTAGEGAVSTTSQKLPEDVTQLATASDVPMEKRSDVVTHAMRRGMKPSHQARAFRQRRYMPIFEGVHKAGLRRNRIPGLGETDLHPAGAV
jgi:hypothetical protein